jgi:hypothetical protein
MPTSYRKLKGSNVFPADAAVKVANAEAGIIAW